MNNLICIVILSCAAPVVLPAKYNLPKWKKQVSFELQIRLFKKLVAHVNKRLIGFLHLFDLECEAASINHYRL